MEAAVHPRPLHRASPWRLLLTRLELGQPRTRGDTARSDEDAQARARPAGDDSDTPAAPRRTVDPHPRIYLYTFYMFHTVTISLCKPNARRLVQEQQVADQPRAGADLQGGAHRDERENRRAKNPHAGGDVPLPSPHLRLPCRQCRSSYRSFYQSQTVGRKINGIF